MIAVAVRDKNVGDALASRGGRDRRQMGLVVRARVDDRNGPAPDDIGVRAEERVGAWVVRHHAANSRRDLLGHPIIDSQIAIEGEFRRHGFLLWGLRNDT